MVATQLVGDRTRLTGSLGHLDLDGLIEATERAVGGDFDAPNSGLLFVVPVTRALGMRPYWKRG
jgi:hypothetical protein